MRHQNSSEMSEQSVIDDLYNLTESDVASTTEYVYDRSRISYPQNSGSGDITGNDQEFGDPGLDRNPEGSSSGVNPMGSADDRVSLEEIPDDDIDAEERDDISDPAGLREASWDGVPDEKEYLDEDISNDNEDLKDTLEETPSVHKKTKYKGGKRRTNKPVAKKSVVVDNNNSNTIKKKVQVAAEETATQRVQVNAGYENPEIPCLGNGCSGVLLKWVLTFYGTEN